MATVQSARLVLCEGLPGSGKSTTAHLMSRHMARQGRPARWYYEFHTPHPIIQYPDILSSIEAGEAKAGMFETAIDQWRTVANDVVQSGESAFVESAFFQIPVHAMRLLNYPDERIEQYVAEVMRAIEAASPLLILLRHEDVARALEVAGALRGDWFLPFLETTVTASAYGRARGLAGQDGVREYFIAYRDLIDRLVTASGLETVRLEADTVTKPEVMRTVAAALGLTTDIRFETSAALELFPGKYLPDTGDGEFDVIVNGEHLALYDGGANTRLIHVGNGTFEIAGMPITLQFIPGADGRMASIDCTGPLPDLARTWVRSS